MIRLPRLCKFGKHKVAGRRIIKATQGLLHAEKQGSWGGETTINEEKSPDEECIYVNISRARQYPKSKLAISSNAHEQEFLQQIIDRLPPRGSSVKSTLAKVI
jgi:hypothetical protein